jgi:hypothetical protein
MKSKMDEFDNVLRFDMLLVSNILALHLDTDLYRDLDPESLSC